MPLKLRDFCGRCTLPGLRRKLIIRTPEKAIGGPPRGRFGGPFASPRFPTVLMEPPSFLGVSKFRRGGQALRGYPGWFRGEPPFRPRLALILHEPEVRQVRGADRPREGAARDNAGGVPT